MFLAQVLEWLPPLVSLCLILIVSRWYLYPAPARPTRSVALLVLGDLGYVLLFLINCETDHSQLVRMTADHRSDPRASSPDEVLG
jgi:hypothetical protein